MIKIRTMERCPHCNNIMFLRLYSEFDQEFKETGVASNVYLDINGIMTMTNYFQEQPQADYECSMCGWEL
jgi:hypothetical protein